MAEAKPIERVYSSLCGQCRKPFSVPAANGFPETCPLCGSPEWRKDRKGREIMIVEESA